MTADLQGAFRALADPSRRAMLVLLSDRDMTIGEVSGHFAMTRAAVKKHLSILEHGRLISVHPRGRQRINRLQPQALKRAADWFAYFERYWDDKLGRLTSAVADAQAKEDKQDD